MGTSLGVYELNHECGTVLESLISNIIGWFYSFTHFLLSLIKSI